MEIYVVKDYKEMSKKAAKIIAEEMKRKKDLVLGLATGSTPEGTYAKLAKMCEKGKIDFSNVVTFNLDEYLGLEDEHEQSYHHFMDKHLFSKVNIKPKNTNVPAGCPKNIEKTCEKYDKKIESLGGIDLQLLGIGNNGHIGFNEPGDVFIPETHVAKLTEATLDANARLFKSKDEVPKESITMGMKSIMNAKKILLLASGSGKANAICMSLSGPITPWVPASILQLHNDLIVVIDEEAAQQILEQKKTMQRARVYKSY
ncbi:MAG: glucosamine-6-phosphate deaminase [Mollicutes bacterium]|nr:glucosamine-6-phosphate deaminase [Mollicutes bacterium]